MRERSRSVEEGKVSTSFAAYAGALWALGLLPQMTNVAGPDYDEEGNILEDARRPTPAFLCADLPDRSNAATFGCRSTRVLPLYGGTSIILKN